MKGVLFDLERLNKLVSAINTKLLPSRKYTVKDLPNAVYDVYYKELNRVRKEFHDLIYGSKTSFIDSYGIIKTISTRCFMGRTDLEYVCFPECTRIYSHAFDGCINLSDFSFPKVSFIEGRTFQSCNALSQVIGLSSVQSLYAYAFCDCKNLSYVSVNLSKIAIGTFSGCENLVTVNIPNATVISGHAFENCIRLSQINLDNVEMIRGYAFANCISLEELSLPKCTSIGGPFTVFDSISCTFINCINLRKVYAPYCQTIHGLAFLNCYSLSDIYMSMLGYIPGWFLISNRALTSISISAFYNAHVIGEFAFKNCGNLENAVFNNVYAILSEAFAGCTKLQHLAFYGEYNKSNMENTTPFFDLPSLLSSFVSNSKAVGFDRWVFSDCKLLSSIIFPNLNYIGSGAFTNCTNLSYISFSQCIFIDNHAFQNCYNLEEINLPNCKFISRSVFYNCSKLSRINISALSLIGNGAFKNCIALQSVSFPEADAYDSDFASEVRGSYSEVFYNCISLQSVYMPNYVLKHWHTSIFENCYNLETLILSSGYSIIGSNVFRNCSQLSSFNFENVIGIKDAAFENCTALSEVIASSCRFLGNRAFKNCTNIVRVQIDSFDDRSVPIIYHTDNVETFANCYSLEEISFGKTYFETSLGNAYGPSMFANCSKLKSIIDSTNGGIYTDAFLNCTSLSIIDLRHKGVYGPRAFANCSNLEEVHIGGFGNRYSMSHEIVLDGLYLAFAGCINLQSLYIYSVEPYYPEKLTFYSCSFLENGRLYVPYSIYSDYMSPAMKWIEYMSADRILSF